MTLMDSIDLPTYGLCIDRKSAFLFNISALYMKTQEQRYHRHTENICSKTPVFSHGCKCKLNYQLLRIDNIRFAKPIKSQAISELIGTWNNMSLCYIQHPEPLPAFSQLKYKRSGLIYKTKLLS